MSRIVEAGHFYAAKGPTLWSKLGWEYLLRVKEQEDKSLLFIDDVHSLDESPKEERHLEVVDFDPKPDFTILESQVGNEAEEIFQRLSGLSKRKRARKRKDGGWTLNGDIRLKFPDGTPSCVLLDAGLCLKKLNLGFEDGINIIPEFYQGEQIKLLRVLKKALPRFSLKVILFNLERNFWEMKT